MTTITSDYTATDLFCGAGGSGLGAEAAGVRLVIAANHWQTAIETHALNHPQTEHDCADISQIEPRRYPTTTFLWASPECTNFSQAKGQKIDPDANGDVMPPEAAIRSRATMWDVPRFAERHQYQVIIVENVVEATRWIMFPAWLQAMQLLGYDYQIVSLNSMHAPARKAPRAPQSRDRIYVVFHRWGNRKPNVTPSPLAYCQTCGTECNAVQTWKNGRTVGRYRQQYIYCCPKGHQVEPYVAVAAEAIDWTLPGMRIGDRERPLSPKTMARIEAGLRRYANQEGLVVPVEGREGKVAMPVDWPMRTLTARAETALLVPYRRTSIPTPTTMPAPTLTTVDPAALLAPESAFIASLRGMNASHNKALRSVHEPLAAVTAGGNHHMLVRHNGGVDTGWQCTLTSQPMHTLTTKGHQSLVAMSENIMDATFRMLEPREIKAGMAFVSTYRLVGNRREQVRQLGNGVTPPASEFLYGAAIESLD